MPDQNCPLCGADAYVICMPPYYVECPNCRGAGFWMRTGAYALLASPRSAYGDAVKIVIASRLRTEPLFGTSLYPVSPEDVDPSLSGRAA